MRLTWLGLLNFGALQWFGVRLARVVEYRRIVAYGVRDPWLGFARPVTVGWRLLRWIVPLTGWWSDYIYIARPRPRAVKRSN